MAKMFNDANLARLIKTAGTERVPVEKLDEEAIKEMALGNVGPTFYELFVARLWDLALSGKEWAATAILHYSIGKPGTQEKSDPLARVVDEKLNDATRHHLNKLAKSAARSAVGAIADARTAVTAGGGGEAERPQGQVAATASAGPRPAGDGAPAPTRRRLDLPKDRDRDSQGS